MEKQKYHTIDVISTTEAPIRAVLHVEAKRPVIRFFDRRHCQTADGRFITNYYLDTLQSIDANTYGIDLSGHKDWVLTPGVLKSVVSIASSIAGTEESLAIVKAQTEVL